MFVRFGGCDYRCSWCDSMYAVEPALVREHARKLTGEEIVGELAGLLETAPPNGMWVTLSGGNPALMDFDAAPFHFPRELNRRDFKVAVETQGTVWRPWLADVDHLTVSPKPPSSGMATVANRNLTAAFLQKAETEIMFASDLRRSLKIVVFDDTDYLWAKELLRCWPGWQAFLSVGTDPIGQWGSDVVAATSHAYTVKAIGDRYAWLAEKVASDPDLRGVRVMPQLHVIAWGHARGV